MADEEERLPMATPRQPNPPPRPSLRDESVRRRAAESLMPEIIRWLRRPDKEWQFRENEREEYIKDLMGIAGEWDGFEAAYKLKSYRYWEADAELVEILDGGWAYGAVNDAIRDWVEANGIAPDFTVGQRVKTKHGVGPITKIHADSASYVVQTDEFLKKSPDQEKYGSGYVIPFEECEAVLEPEAAET